MHVKILLTLSFFHLSEMLDIHKHIQPKIVISLMLQLS